MSRNTNALSLLGRRRFLPFFVTQFLGAFNDNVFKNALIIMITFSIAESAASSNLVNLAAGLFILPFFLFSALAGQLADRSDKAVYMRRIKLAEILIMIGGAAGFFLNSVPILLVVLFFMGTQSAFFGPAKYAILPQHLKTGELVSGNALVESGTFLAILLGTIGGGVLISTETYGRQAVGITVLSVALLGFVASRGIPAAKSNNPGLSINYNLAGETIAVLKHLGGNRTIFLSVLGISWFWFLGAVYLTQFPNYTKLVLLGDAGVATTLLALFSVGIGIGSFICEKISRGRIEVGIVPIGAIGMTIFGIHLGMYEPAAGTQIQNTIAFIETPENIFVLIDLLLISISGGLYIVPLYTLVQHLSDPERRSRVIAANNILNAIFMVGAAALAIVVLGAGYSISELFLLIALINIGVSIYIFGKAPEFLFRMLGWLLVHSFYRVEKQNLYHIPEQGGVVLVSNHVSFADAIIIHAICPRRLRFVMDNDIYSLPVLNWLFRSVGAIPVADPRKDRHLVRKSYELIADALEKGEAVCIFPEGGITRNGEIQSFKKGIEKILSRTPVPVVPIALRGLWGSFFSFHGSGAMRGLPRRWFSRISVVADSAVPADSVSAVRLQQAVQSLRGTER